MHSGYSYSRHHEYVRGYEILIRCLHGAEKRRARAFETGLETSQSHSSNTSNSNGHAASLESAALHYKGAYASHSPGVRSRQFDTTRAPRKLGSRYRAHSVCRTGALAPPTSSIARRCHLTLGWAGETPVDRVTGSPCKRSNFHFPRRRTQGTSQITTSTSTGLHSDVSDVHANNNSNTLPANSAISFAAVPDWE